MDVLGVFLGVALVWLIIYLAGRALVGGFSSSTVDGGQCSQQQLSGSQTFVVTTPNQLIAAINDVHSGRARHTYVVRVDARQWDLLDVQYAKWLKQNPRKGIRVERLLLPKEG